MVEDCSARGLATTLCKNATPRRSGIAAASKRRDEECFTGWSESIQAVRRCLREMGKPLDQALSVLSFMAPIN